MHNLTEFLAKHNHWFVFLVLEVVSMVLLFRYNSYQGSVWFSSANAVTGKVYEWDSAVESFFSLSGVNSQLTQRNAFLEQQVRMLDDSIARLTRSQEAAVTRLSSMVPFQGCRLIPAKVVANMVNRYDNLITIDKGSADGVKRDMGVVCGMGVGRHCLLGVRTLQHRHPSSQQPFQYQLYHTAPWLFRLSALARWLLTAGLSRGRAKTCSLQVGRQCGDEWIFIGLPSRSHGGKGSACVQFGRRTVISCTG